MLYSHKVLNPQYNTLGQEAGAADSFGSPTFLSPETILAPAPPSPHPLRICLILRLAQA